MGTIKTDDSSERRHLPLATGGVCAFASSLKLQCTVGSNPTLRARYFGVPLERWRLHSPDRLRQEWIIHIVEMGSAILAHL
jgi:hypothetical protein